MTGVLILLALAALVAYLNANWRAHERARHIARQACDRAGVQFLDSSVVRRRLRPVRHRGNPVLRREYVFEFAGDGVERRRGWLILRGAALERITLDWPEGGRTVDEVGGGSHDPE
ncbi:MULTISPECIES: DUF3301 domain-containing protein [unclassified Thioalkalivibrio]|uniref:DUF3301 domain-containing protein n=1 Tax=unclassified Thioalkalivibrio TaxID=2621013 RepID=UPI00037A8C69|nr:MULTISPECIES: DUF3301 domain-containing protein [unclassified Thioalkalivibrio]